MNFKVTTTAGTTETVVADGWKERGSMTVFYTWLVTDMSYQDYQDEAIFNTAHVVKIEPA